MLTCMFLVFFFKELKIGKMRVKIFIIQVLGHFPVRIKHIKKNPAYGRHRISRPMLIEAPIQKEAHKATVQQSAVQCSVVQNSAVHCTALYCTTLHYTAVHCTVLHCTALHCGLVCFFLYWCFYQHRSRDSVSPVCKIFF